MNYLDKCFIKVHDHVSFFYKQSNLIKFKAEKRKSVIDVRHDNRLEQLKSLIAPKLRDGRKSPNSPFRLFHHIIKLISYKT